MFKEKIALAHDSFTQMGGAERVFTAIHELYPDSPVFTTIITESMQKDYKGWDIKTTFLQTLQKFVPGLQYLLFLIPYAVSKIDTKSFKLVLSSSSGFIKNIQVPKGQIHINYCHTPARFLWINEGYITQELPLILKPFTFIFKSFLKWMKGWDYRGAQRVTAFIANSKEVQNRIKKYYNKESTVIHPFVDINFWHPTKPREDYFLIAGRLHAHKHNEVIIQIFNKLGLPLHVVGTGRQEEYLKSIAKPNIKFLGRVSDEVLRDEYSGAKAFIFPQLEDFGMMPIEAASCGTATLALGQGGSLETVLPNITGQLFDKADPEIISRYILSWNANNYSLHALQNHAKNFSKQIFQQKIATFVENTLDNHSF